MCFGSSPTAPPPPAALPEAPRPPASTGAADTGTADRRRRAIAAGENTRSTILTSPRGVTDTGATQTKTLLGA